MLIQPFIDGVECFECRKPANHNHHVIPRVLGGTKTLPLCVECHGKVHGKNFTRMRELQRMGIEAAKKRNGGKAGWGGRKVGTRISVTVEREATIIRLYGEGVSVPEIIKHTGLSRPTVYRVIKAHKTATQPPEPSLSA